MYIRDAVDNIIKIRSIKFAKIAFLDFSISNAWETRGVLQTALIIIIKIDEAKI